MNQNDDAIKKQDFTDMVPDIVKDKADQLKNSIYFESLFIDKMRIKFSFTSNPDFLNQALFSPTLKFLIAMMMNMKQVELHFQRYTIASDPVSIPVFISNIKNHYLNECFSHKQLLRVLSSLGLLGNLHETINNFKIAIIALIENPNRDGNYLIVGIAGNLYNFLRYTLYAVSNTLTEIADSVFNGLNSLISHRRSTQTLDTNTDNSLDIEQEFLDNINSIAGALDTQNKIWLNSFLQLENYQNQDMAKSTHQIQTEDQKVDEVDIEAPKIELETKSKRDKIIDKISSIRGFPVSLKHIPIAVLYAIYQFIKKINRKVKYNKGQDVDRRVRNPRYFGYTKELENYSYKKALAIKIVPIDDITDIFTFNKTEMILTENRVLCITQGSEMEDLNYWTLKYSDILSVKLSLEKSFYENDSESINTSKEVQSRKVVSNDETRDSQDKSVVENGAKFKIDILYYNDTFQFGNKEIYDTFKNKKSARQAVSKFMKEIHIRIGEMARLSSAPFTLQDIIEE